MDIHKEIDIHAIQGEKITHVASIHRDGAEDSGPVHMISLARLERYWAIEAAARAMVQLLDDPVPDDINTPG